MVMELICDASVSFMMRRLPAELNPTRLRLINLGEIVRTRLEDRQRSPSPWPGQTQCIQTYRHQASTKRSTGSSNDES